MRVFGVNVKKRYRRPAGTTVGPVSFGYNYISRTYPYENEALSRVPVVYACINHIAGQLAMLPRKVVNINTGREEKPPPWLERPNSYMTGSDMIQALASSLLIYGNSYIIPSRLVDKNGIRGRMVSLHFPRHTDVEPVRYGNNDTQWYIGGKEFEGEFYHIRYLTVPDTVLGVGPMSALRRLLQVSDGTLEYMDRFIDQGGAYQLILSYPQNTPNDVLDDALESVLARNTGPNNAYEPLVIGGGAQVIPVNQTTTDGGYLDMRTMTDAQIISYGFNLDPHEFGINSGSESLSYTNEPARWYRTWQRALRPLAHLIEENLSLLVGPNQRVKLDQREFLVGGPHSRGQLISQLVTANQQWAAANEGEQLFTREEIRDVGGWPA